MPPAAVSSSASPASPGAIGFCNGAAAAASHFPPPFGRRPNISTRASAMRSGSWRGAVSRWSARSRATGSSRSPAAAHGSRKRLRRHAPRYAVRSRRSVAPWSTRSAAIVSAILIGDRAGLDAEVERRLQEAGTYHVIAISGGNIAILAGLSMFLLRSAVAGPRWPRWSSSAC